MYYICFAYFKILIHHLLLIIMILYFVCIYYVLMSNLLQIFILALKHINIVFVTILCIIYNTFLLFLIFI